MSGKSKQRKQYVVTATVTKVIWARDESEIQELSESWVQQLGDEDGPRTGSIKTIYDVDADDEIIYKT